MNRINIILYFLINFTSGSTMVVLGGEFSDIYIKYRERQNFEIKPVLPRFFLGFAVRLASQDFGTFHDKTV